MTLRTRLGLSLLAIVVILVVPLIIAMRALDQIHRETRALREGEFAASLLLGRLREGLNDLRRQETALLFVHDAASRDAMQRQVTTLSRLADSLDLYSLDRSASDIRRTIAEIVLWAPQEYRAALAGQGDSAEKISTSHLVPALSQADESLGIAERALRQRTAERVARAAATISAAKNVASIAGLLALVLAGAVAIGLMRYIARPVKELQRGMEAVTEGDLEFRLAVSSDRRDEFGRLSDSFQRMTRQLGELDKLKAEFVSVASHELKTPINVVLGYLQLLEEGIYGPLSTQQHEIHQTIGAQMNTLARLVRQLLDISRFEAGGGKLEPRTVPLGPFLDDLERSFRVLAIQREIRFIVRREEGLPEEVTWDADRMNEVLGNLLSNAFKFTPRRGEVELGVQRVDGSLQMEVRDTGAGISAEQLPHVFEKFYQADNQRAASATGSGLGLAIAKSIVEAHGGTIECESTPGVGTTFTITIPMRSNGRRSSVQRAMPAAVA
ncbi:MAG TPA: HAMP domain-containing sensor histidine kinase [Gemmatimonadaceae bacterium]|nr:HAMP domain-containing sensor histidine kinase [Gemmatimonadaceae bacterium]